MFCSAPSSSMEWCFCYLLPNETEQMGTFQTVVRWEYSGIDGRLLICCTDGSFPERSTSNLTNGHMATADDNHGWPSLPIHRQRAASVSHSCLSCLPPRSSPFPPRFSCCSSSARGAVRKSSTRPSPANFWVDRGYCLSLSFTASLLCPFFSFLHTTLLASSPNNFSNPAKTQQAFFGSVPIPGSVTLPYPSFTHSRRQQPPYFSVDTFFPLTVLVVFISPFDTLPILPAVSRLR